MTPANTSDFSVSGSVSFVNQTIQNEKAKIANAISSKGVTTLSDVVFVISPIIEPVRIGVNVAAREFNEPPVCISWLPRFPPPPRRFNIGFTTVLRIQTQKPHTNAPKR